MRQKGDTKLRVTLILVALFLVAGYFAYNKFIPGVLKVLPSDGSSDQNQKSLLDLPSVTEPKSGSKITSPVTIRGTVPPGWMFEGVFPIKLLDSNRKLIAQTQATEEAPGSWQSNVSVYFKATVNFSTSAKSGFLVLEKDNPSGLPTNSKTFEVPVSF